MNTEERLTRALHDEADRVDPDVDRMYAATLRRLTKPGVRRTGELLWPLLVAVVVLALLVGSAVILQHHWQKTVVPAGTSKAVPAGTSKAGGVSTSFTCPGQITVDDAGRKRDDSFLPSIDVPPHVHVSQDRIAQAAADEAGAPRYSYVENGDDAALRLGNADGSLASISTFHRSPAGWDLVTTTKCAAKDGGILVPVDDPLRLGAHGTKPYPARSMIDNPESAVLVDDRSTYDEAGLVKHHTIWASQCGPRICVVGGTPTSMVLPEIKAAQPPGDITSLLLAPDLMVGRTRSLVLWVVYDADRSVSSIVMRLRDGTTLPAVRKSGPGWRGRAYFALGRPDEVESVLVRHRGGTTTTYPAKDITDPNVG